MAKKSTKSTPIKKSRGKKPVDTSWHDRFLELLSQWCNVTLACRGVGIDRKTAYIHKKNMPDFAEAWEQAIEEAIDVLEGEAWQRARKTSDTLMIFLLKAHKPEKYRDRFEHSHSGPGGGAIPVSITDMVAKIYGRDDSTDQESGG